MSGVLGELDTSGCVTHTLGVPQKLVTTGQLRPGVDVLPFPDSLFLLERSRLRRRAEQLHQLGFPQAGGHGAPLPDRGDQHSVAAETFPVSHSQGYRSTASTPRFGGSCCTWPLTPTRTSPTWP